MAAGAPKSREHDFPKKCPNFLKFIGPVTTLWVLQTSAIMRVVSTGLLLARAFCTRSIRLHAWQPGSQNPGSTISRKKKRPFLNFIGPVTPPWVLYPFENMHLVFTEPLPARAVFIKSIKVLGWQPGAPKSQEYDLPKKNPDFLKFIGPVTTLWVLQPS